MVIEMLAMNATQARNEWSTVVDAAVREKPQFIKRTRDYMILSNLETLEVMLSAYSFHAQTFTEEDGSITISLDELDLAENGADESEARHKLASAMLEYAVEYYKDFAYWARGNRKAHLPYVFKALILDDVEKIGGLIECHHGES